VAWARRRLDDPLVEQLGPLEPRLRAEHGREVRTASGGLVDERCEVDPLRVPDPAPARMGGDDLGVPLRPTLRPPLATTLLDREHVEP
jgi:hypothetical protein